MSALGCYQHGMNHGRVLWGIQQCIDNGLILARVDQMVNKDAQAVAGRSGSELFEGAGEFDDFLEISKRLVSGINSCPANQAATYTESFLTTFLKLSVSFMSGRATSPCSGDELRCWGVGRRGGIVARGPRAFHLSMKCNQVVAADNA